MFFKTITFGRLLTIISICIGFIALFLPWIDVQIQTDKELLTLTHNGFSRQNYFLFIFFIYPIYCILKKRPLRKTIGVLLAALLLVLTYSMIEMQIVFTETSTINANGIGIYIFLVSSCLFFLSVLFKNDVRSFN